MKNSKKDEKACALIDKFVEVRKEKGFTQANLAEKSGNSQQVISRIENKTNIPQLNTFCELLDVLGYKVSIQPITTNANKKKIDEEIINEDIELTDIPDDNVITYTVLKEFISDDPSGYYAKRIKDLEHYINPRNRDIVCIPEINYCRMIVLNALIEIKNMLDKDKISKKRLERIKDDLKYCQEAFEEITSDIEYIAEFEIESLIEIINDINDYDDDEFDDEEE